MIIPNYLTHCEPTKNDLLQHQLTTSDPDFSDSNNNLCIGGNDCCSYKEFGVRCNLGEGSCSEDQDCQGGLIGKLNT